MKATIRDGGLSRIHEQVVLMHCESDRQIFKWGIQECTPQEWLSYLMEEIGELAQAISEEHYRGGPPSDVVKEAIQAATLTLKIAEAYMDPSTANAGKK